MVQRVRKNQRERLAKTFRFWEISLGDKTEMGAGGLPGCPETEARAPRRWRPTDDHKCTHARVWIPRRTEGASSPPGEKSETSFLLSSRVIRPMREKGGLGSCSSEAGVRLPAAVRHCGVDLRDCAAVAQALADAEVRIRVCGRAFLLLRLKFSNCPQDFLRSVSVLFSYS